MLDANEVALKNYLRELDDGDRRMSMIRDRANELMHASFNHLTFSNIVEALSEASNQEAVMFEQALKAGNEYIGKAVVTISHDYWYALALSQAEDEINDEWSSCTCHGVGCSRCREDDE